MYIIGERLNSTRRAVKDALESRNAHFLLHEAKKQIDRGSSAIDLNAATLMDGEQKALEWAISLLQDQFSVAISIDTPNKSAMEAGLKACRAARRTDGSHCGQAG